MIHSKMIKHIFCIRNIKNSNIRLFPNFQTSNFFFTTDRFCSIDGNGLKNFFHCHLQMSRSDLHDKLKDRKSTRLNSSHANISYAVFCLKKKKNIYSVRLIYEV